MPERDPTVARVGLVAALVRAGLRRFRYRITVHRLLGIRPPNVPAIARPGGYGARDLGFHRARIDPTAAAAAALPWRIERSLDASADLRATERAMPIADTAAPHAHAAPPAVTSAVHARRAELPAAMPAGPLQTRAAAPASPTMPATRPTEPPIREPHDGVRHAGRTFPDIDPATDAVHVADVAAAPPTSVTSRSLPPTPWGTRVAAASAASRPAAMAPDHSASRRAAPSEPGDHAGEPFAAAPVTAQTAMRGDPLARSTSAAAPISAPRALAGSRASSPGSIAGPPGDAAATIAMPGRTARRLQAHHVAVATEPPPTSAPAPATATSSSAAATSSARLVRAPARGMGTPRVPLLTTLPPARSGAASDARLQDKVLELTREVAALRQSQREASLGTAAPRRDPSPAGASPVRAERAVRVPTDVIWARRHLGSLRFRVSR